MRLLPLTTIMIRLAAAAPFPTRTVMGATRDTPTRLLLHHHDNTMKVETGQSVAVPVAGDMPPPLSPPVVEDPLAVNHDRPVLQDEEEVVPEAPPPVIACPPPANPPAKERDRARNHQRHRHLPVATKYLLLPAAAERSHLWTDDPPTNAAADHDTVVDPPPAPTIAPPPTKAITPKKAFCKRPSPTNPNSCLLLSHHRPAASRRVVGLLPWLRRIPESRRHKPKGKARCRPPNIRNHRSIPKWHKRH